MAMVRFTGVNLGAACDDVDQGHPLLAGQRHRRCGGGQPHATALVRITGALT
ncbi:hypothetical protein D3C78_1550470 [compost metagenome]